MLEASGFRLGNLNSGQSQGFGGNFLGGQANQKDQSETSGNGEADDDGVDNTDASAEQSENLINIQA